MKPDYIPDQADIIRLDLDPVKGREIAKRRPVIVLTPREYNVKTSLCICCPITSSIKGYPGEVAVPDELPVAGVVLADQVRTLSWTSRNPEYITNTYNLYLDVVFTLEPLILPMR